MSGDNRIPQNRTFKKDRKGNKGRIKGIASRGYKITHGDYGLKAMAAGKITPEQIEAMRRAMVRCTKGGSGGKDNNNIIIKVFPNKPVSKKPIGTRMGGGKGSVDHWVCIVKPGKVLFEITGVPEATAQHALRLAASKLPIETRFISRKDYI